MTPISLELIRTDGGTQPRATMNWVVVSDYAEAMRSGTIFPPVVVFDDGVDYWLGDGFHRLAATKETQATAINAEVRQGSLPDAQWYACGANRSHGLRRTNDDKAAAVRAALSHPHGVNLSDGDIAAHCGVTSPTVAKYRAELKTTLNILESTRRRGRDGRTINTVKIGKKAPSPAVVDAVRQTSIADNPAEVAALAMIAPEQQIAVVEQIACGEAEHVKDAFKQVLKAQRRQNQSDKQTAALAAIPSGEQTWTVTGDTAVIPCHALITDPPYGILEQDWEPANLESFTCDWARRWNACGADIVLVFWSQRHLFDGRGWFDAALTNYAYQQTLIWHYPNNKSPQSRMGFKQTYEPILFYRRLDSHRQIGVSGDAWGNGLNDFDCHVAAVPQSNFNDADMKQHPAQKPVSVFRWLINAVTEPGELVCDPFAGSGASGIAATQLQRRYHGIDTSAEYCTLASERIALYGTL